MSIEKDVVNRFVVFKDEMVPKEGKKHLMKFSLRSEFPKLP